MINNTTPGRWDRINAKSLDQQFMLEMIRGLNCSRFEAEAIAEKVHEVYSPVLEERGIQPGQITISVIRADVPPPVPLKEAAQQLVRLTLHAGPDDVAVRKAGGVPALRQHRLARMAEEAFQQGGLLTLEDLSILLNCGVRTLVGDLSALRRDSIVPPLRSTVQDMGRAVTHRGLIIRNWLQGMEYTAIARKCHHYVESVARYVDKFKRCQALLATGMEPAAVALVAKVSIPLAEEFRRLLTDADVAPHRREELDQLGKKTAFHRAAPGVTP